MARTSPALFWRRRLGPLPSHERRPLDRGRGRGGLTISWRGCIRWNWANQGTLGFVFVQARRIDRSCRRRPTNPPAPCSG